MKLRLVNGVWSTLELWPQNNPFVTLRNSNSDSNLATGDYGLYAMQICDASNLYGFLDGVYFISGFNNAAENTVSIASVDYLVVPNIWRTGFKDYMAVKLQ